MQTITLNLDDSQLSSILAANGIAVGPENDFADYVQSQIDSRLIPLYRDYVKKKKVDIATQLVDFDIADKVQEVIDVIKLDPTANYEVKVRAGEVVEPPVEEIIIP